MIIKSPAQIFNFVLYSLVIFYSFSCATLPTLKKSEHTAAELFEYACAPGKGVRTAGGRIAAKVSSSEFSGQFLAHVLADSDGHLKLDVTNPLGGTQVLIQVNQGNYKIINYADRDQKPQNGKDYWGGIPLKWASSLFLGRIPCPPSDASLRLELGTEGELIATWSDSNGSDHQRFVYRFKRSNQAPWPSSLSWTRDAKDSSQVDFEFESPEETTRSPEKWEARSSQGQVKVKWRTREITRD
jgi:hypothetical protein